MREEFAILLFFFGISLTANLGFAIAWFRSARRVRRLEDHLLSAGQPDDRRTDRLEQAVDAVAGQVDQLASGQEFLNRIVAERLNRLPHLLDEPERATTPH
jgi:HAMP domain-containing protein